MGLEINDFDALTYNPFIVPKGVKMIDHYPDLATVEQFQRMDPFDDETTNDLVRILAVYCDANSPLNRIKDIDLRKETLARLLKPCPAARDEFYKDTPKYLSLMFRWFNHTAPYKYELFLTEELNFRGLMHDARNGKLSTSDRIKLNSTAQEMIKNLDKLRAELFPDAVSKGAYVEHEAEESLSGMAEKFAKKSV